MQIQNKPWSIQGKYVVITGATSGIGLAAAKELAKRGAHLGIIARNPDKAAKTAALLRQIAGSDSMVDIFLADMSSQQSIRQAAEALLSSWPQIDVLINNAGAMFMERKLTEDGTEMTWAVNHLAPFLLTTLLIDRLKQSGGRIITTASYGHKMAKEGIRFDDLTAERCYSLPHRLLLGASVRYAETKLANILFTSELAKRLQGTGATAHCFNPGLVSTNFNQGNGWAAQLTMAIMKLYSRPPEKGAETLVWLADSDEISGQSGHYYTDKQIDVPKPHAQDSETAKRLWEVSLEQIQS